MTWRRFETLLRGLGPNSACAAHAHQRRQSGFERVKQVSTPQAAESTFQALFKPTEGKGK